MKQPCYFSTNLKFLRERKGLSQEKLSLELSMTRSQLSAYEKGQTKNPTLGVLMAVSEYFKISIDIFLKTDLTQVTQLKLQEYESRSDQDISGKELRVIVTTVNVNGKQNIEHVPVKAKAGYTSGYGDPAYVSKLPVFSLPHLSRDKKYRSFQTEGDSMYPFPERAIVIGEYIDDWLTIKDGTECIVVTKSEGIVFKKIINDVAGSRSYILHSLNPGYQPYTISVEDVLEIWKYKCHISEEIPNKEVSLYTVLSALERVNTDIRLIKRAIGT